MVNLLDQTAVSLKKSARTSLETTIGVMRRLHLPLEIIAGALIDYTAEFCTQIGKTNTKEEFEKALLESQKTHKV